MHDAALTEFLKDGDPRCPTCGHGLQGLSAPVCPECGKPLSLRLVKDGWSVPGLSLRALLWWVLALGLVTLGLDIWFTWQIFKPIQAMAVGAGQPASFLKFYWELNLTVVGIITALRLAAIFGSVSFHIALWHRPGNTAVTRWAKWFCIAALVASVAVFLLDLL